MPKYSSVLFIQKGNTLVMPHHMSKIGLNLVILTLVGEIESSYCQIIFEEFILWVVKGVVGSIIPESRILISIMARTTLINDCKLSYC